MLIFQFLFPLKLEHLHITSIVEARKVFKLNT